MPFLFCTKQPLWLSFVFALIFLHQCSSLSSLKTKNLPPLIIKLFESTSLNFTYTQPSKGYFLYLILTFFYGVLNSGSGVILDKFPSVSVPSKER